MHNPQGVCSTSVLAKDGSILCVSVEVLSVKCKEDILIQLFEQYLEIADITI